VTLKNLPITRPSFDSAERQEIDEALSSGWVTQGPKTAKFEQLFAARHQVPHAIATNSCTSALHLCTLSLGIGPGDEVIVPAFTWVTSAYCVEYVGAKVSFADIKLDTFNLDPVALEAAITPSTRAIIVVHLFGQSAEMDPILAIAKRHGLYVIEDAACAVGTEYDSMPVGGLGDFGCFSFHPRKVITTGEGGMVTTHDNELAATVNARRNHGTRGIAGPPSTPPKPYEMGRWEELGFNFRMCDLQGAVGIAQMTKLDALLAERLIFAQRYNTLLMNAPGLVLPTTTTKCGHTYQSYVVRISEGGRQRRNDVMEAAAERGVQTRPGTHAVHRLGFFANQGIEPEEFPNSCEAEDCSITLPLYPGMTDAEQDRVVDALLHAI